MGKKGNIMSITTQLSRAYIITVCGSLALILAIVGYVMLAGDVNAGEKAFNSVLVDNTELVLHNIVTQLSATLFYPVLGIPFLVLWLIVGSVFFTIRMGFVNIRMFCHAFAVISGKYSSPDDPGEVSHFQALAAAVSATVGLGNIAGVAVAVSMGGPGAVVWMAIAGLFGMTTKFVEVTMGQKYRKISKKGKVSGGAFHYLKDGLAEKNFPRLGKALAVIFSLFCVVASFGGGNMFQANQSVAILTNTFDSLGEIDWVIALGLAVSVGIVLIGGIRRIAGVAETVVPLMAIIYVGAALVVIVVNIDNLGHALVVMFKSAFGLEAVGGGVMGALIAGVRRSAFSNEAGMGSAPIAHAAARTSEPVREGCVALLEPFIDTVVICFITGLVITITGVYQDPSVGDGVVLTSAAFATVADWFPIVLSVAIVLFAYSTMITWSYYGERAWEYLFGNKTVGIFHVMFCSATFFGGIVDLKVVIDFSDLLLLSMALPNLLGLYILSGDVRRDLNEYCRKLKDGAFKTY